MKVLVLWYSRTGTVERLARAAGDLLAAAGHDVSAARLEPQLEIPYWLWLAVSFVPGARFPLKGEPPEVAGFDACLLLTPKWTLACPVVNELLVLRGRELPPTAVAVACGGFDQERYTDELAGRLAGLGVPVLGRLALKKDHVLDGRADGALLGFLERCFPAARAPADEHETAKTP